ncbi:MAG: hypothetical protein JWQ10_3488 [Herbaspirillum sp.]|nr:hypothetical protein [Herbaspirillum sp.]
MSAAYSAAPVLKQLWRGRAKRILLVLLALGFGTQLAMASGDIAPLSGAALSVPSAQPAHVSFGLEKASQDARNLADWITASNDNYGMPFVIVDKKQAKVFVFHPDGQLRGASSVLLGLGRGDASVPGIGERKLSSIRPDERTTPAGRFVAALARDLRGAEILWVDYDSAIAMHPVVTTNAKERRTQRLASASLLDKRITYGCINVPAYFYKNVVSPTFKGTSGIVYVLPESRSMQQVFISYVSAPHTQ